MFKNLSNNHYIKKYNIQSNIICGKSILQLQDCPIQNIGEKTALIIADENTFPICAGYIAKNFAQAKKIILPDGVKPKLAICRKIASENNVNIKHIIAIGSGVINDIAKYSSFLLKIPYSIIATATSQNGYASANASLINDCGSRQSYPAKIAKNILLDASILRNAPKILIKSGYGDAICRYTAGCDYYLSSIKKFTAYNTDALKITEATEKIIFSENFNLDDGKNILALAENLVLSGIGMTIAGNSAPASGAEHMIAHYLESKGKLNSLHGEAVGVFAIITAKMQQIYFGRGQVEKTALKISNQQSLGQSISESPKNLVTKRDSLSRVFT